MSTRKAATPRRSTRRKPDALRMLKDDHDKVKGLFEKFQNARRDDERKGEVGQTICKELTVHAQLEEIFYPAVREAIDDDDVMNEAVVEHGSAKELIAEIEKMSPDEDMFDNHLPSDLPRSLNALHPPPPPPPPPPLPPPRMRDRCPARLRSRGDVPSRTKCCRTQSDRRRGACSDDSRCRTATGAAIRRRENCDPDRVPPRSLHNRDSTRRPDVLRTGSRCRWSCRRCRRSRRCDARHHWRTHPSARRRRGSIRCRGRGSGSDARPRSASRRQGDGLRLQVEPGQIHALHPRSQCGSTSHNAVVLHRGHVERGAGEQQRFSIGCPCEHPTRRNCERDHQQQRREMRRSVDDSAGKTERT